VLALYVVGTATSPRYTASMSSVEHWSGVAPEAHFFTKIMDELLTTTTETSEQLLERARDLRSAYLKIALRYEQTAAARVASS
jgi:hypothetical protein